jgi:hypothetical protein
MQGFNFLDSRKPKWRQVQSREVTVNLLGYYPSSKLRALKQQNEQSSKASISLKRYCFTLADEVVDFTVYPTLQYTIHKRSMRISNTTIILKSKGQIFKYLHKEGRILITKQLRISIFMQDLKGTNFVWFHRSNSNQ